MSNEMILFGRLLAFYELATQELKLLHRDLNDLRSMVSEEPEEGSRFVINNCLSRVDFVARQCLNVHGRSESPAPLKAEGEV